MSENLREKAVSASIWRTIESFALQGTNLAVQIVLARLLLPEEFGLIAMVWFFIVLTETFVASGFGYALVQSLEATEEDKCSVFYFNLVAAAFGFGILYLVAPVVATFYGQPILKPITRALSAKVLIGALGNVQFSVLLRNMNFKSRCAIELSASILSGAIAITAAMHGLGVWSLVIYQLVREATRTIVATIRSNWKPGRSFALSSLRRMLPFGSNMLLASLLESLAKSTCGAMIGKLFMPADMGFYSRAHRLQELPSQNLTSVVAGVAFPMFSRLQADPARLTRAFSQIFELVGFLAAPAMLFLAATARPLVLFLLTEKWLPCVPYLQILSIAGITEPLYILNTRLILSMGKSRMFFQLHLFRQLLVLAGIVIAFRWGLIGVVLAEALSGFIAALVNAYHAGGIVNFGLGRQARTLLPYLAISSVLSGLLYTIGAFSSLPSGPTLAVQLVVGVSAYWILCHKLRLPACSFIVELARNRVAQWSIIQNPRTLFQRMNPASINHAGWIKHQTKNDA